MFRLFQACQREPRGRVLRPCYHGHLPGVGVVALLPEACTDGSALLLDDGSFVGNRLGRTHIADELFHCSTGSISGYPVVLERERSAWPYKNSSWGAGRPGDWAAL